MNLTEKQIEKGILSWLLFNGVYAFKINTTGIYDPKKKVFRTPSRFVMKGCSDILGILPNGTFLAIEVKTPFTMKRYTKRPTPSDFRQQRFIAEINKRKGIAFCASSLKEVSEKLSPFLRRPNDSGQTLLI